MGNGGKLKLVFYLVFIFWSQNCIYRLIGNEKCLLLYTVELSVIGDIMALSWDYHGIIMGFSWDAVQEFLVSVRCGEPHHHHDLHQASASADRTRTSGRPM